ncbi:hypothetical protein DLM76_20675 [Leptospira yasudae]|nr:hypothetical protein DLM76_20675 [Leptospira yasudae]
MDPLEIYRIQPAGERPDGEPLFEVYNRFTNEVVYSRFSRPICAGWVIDQHLRYIGHVKFRELSKTA